MLNLFIGLIFAIYVLAQKEKLKRQTKNLLQAYLKQPVSETVWKVGKLTSITFQKFISGQCLEACILGTMFFITMSIFQIPYALLISVLIAVTSLIPIWGSIYRMYHRLLPDRGSGPDACVGIFDHVFNHTANRRQSDLSSCSGRFHRTSVDLGIGSSNCRR